MQSEKKIIKKAKKDKQAFVKLYEHYFPKLYGFVLIRVKNKEQTEDIVQQTFLKALENIKKFNWRGFSFGSWLFRIAVNESVNLYRENKLTQFFEQQELENLELVSESAQELLIAKQEQVRDKQNFQKIIQKMSCLKQDEKTVLQLKYISGLSYKQISQIINKKPKTLAVMLYRAIKKLKNSLVSS